MKQLLAVIILMTFLGCDLQNEARAISSMADEEKVWVFIQLNVREETDGLESYYYYAQISKNLYEAVSFNDITSGFILLENVKYWGDQDLIYDYKGVENAGDIVFRIEDVVKLELVNKEPQVGKGMEQFDEPQVIELNEIEQPLE